MTSALILFVMALLAAATLVLRVPHATSRYAPAAVVLFLLHNLIANTSVSRKSSRSRS